MQPEETKAEQWAVVELMGKEQIAGKISQATTLGMSVIRVTVPENTKYPAFTRDFHPQAIFSITYTSEEVARTAAHQFEKNPVIAYIYDLKTIPNLRQRLEDATIKVEELEDERNTLRAENMDLQKRLREIADQITGKKPKDEQDW